MPRRAPPGALPSARRPAGTGPAFLTQLRAILSENRTDETFADATCEPSEAFTDGGMLAHVLTYAAHRRTLVTGALWDLHIRDLQDDPMHWVGQGL